MKKSFYGKNPPTHSARH